MQPRPMRGERDANGEDLDLERDGFCKAKMWEDESERIDGRMDELLAVLSYKGQSSDMAEVAQKLEQQ
ncbi:hypothetical protein ACFX15_018044 [Malus domestica]